MNGKFIMVDGMDGSGKSTAVQNFKEYLTKEGNTIFDLKQYWLDNGKYPEYSELKSYDFIFSGEPTYAGIGKVIREEFVRNGTNYSKLAIAEAYSLDRLVLYNKIIVPALKDGKCVIQDRGVSTSLCYQVLTGLDLKTLCELPGNAFALDYAPNHLVIFKLDPKEALNRLEKRTGKQDNAIFEKLDFQMKAAELFYSEEYQKLFSAHGTKVHYLLANDAIDIMKAKALELFKQLLNT